MVSDIETNISLEEKFFSDYVPVGSNSYMDSLLASIPGSSRLEGFSFDLNLLICHDFNGAGKVIFHEDTAPKQEQRTLDTRLGFKVRSKSEIMIAQSLYSNGFSFAYEMPLVLNGVTYYPDFTIFLGDNKFAVWEHLGLTGLSSYNEKSCKKINSYLNHGFVFQETLFITSENSNSALDYAGIDTIISILKSQMLL